eukprot:EG_transcript_14588
MVDLVRFQWKCRSCGSDDVVEDHSAGDMVCRNCGLVAAERICQEGEDERHFESDDLDRKHNEVVDELTDPYDMSTRIRHNGSNAAAELRSAQRASKEDNAQMRCFMEIDTLAHKVPGGVPTACKEKAKHLAKLFLERSVHARSQRLKPVSTAALYLALTRFEERPNIKFDVMAECARLDLKVVVRYCQRMEDACKAELPVQKRRDLIGMYIDALRLPYNVKAACERIHQRAMSLPSCNGKKPETVVAAVMLFYVRETENQCNLDGDQITADRIAAVSNVVAASTITSCYRDSLLPHAKQLLAP